MKTVLLELVAEWRAASGPDEDYSQGVVEGHQRCADDLEAALRDQPEPLTRERVAELLLRAAPDISDAKREAYRRAGFVTMNLLRTPKIDPREIGAVDPCEVCGTTTGEKRSSPAFGIGRQSGRRL